MIYVLPVVTRDAHIVAKLIYKRVLDLKIEGIWAIYMDPKIKGYLFIEADNQDAVKSAIAGVKGIKLRSQEILTITQEELEQILKKLIHEEKEVINIGDIVEITKGPFAGEKAKIRAINTEKGIYTVVLLDLPTVIPIDLPAKNIRLLKSSKE